MAIKFTDGALTGGNNVDVILEATQLDIGSLWKKSIKTASAPIEIREGVNKPQLDTTPKNFCWWGNDAFPVNLPQNAKVLSVNLRKAAANGLWWPPYLVQYAGYEDSVKARANFIFGAIFPPYDPERISNVRCDKGALIVDVVYIESDNASIVSIPGVKEAGQIKPVKLMPASLSPIYAHYVASFPAQTINSHTARINITVTVDPDFVITGWYIESTNAGTWWSGFAQIHDISADRTKVTFSFSTVANASVGNKVIPTDGSDVYWETANVGGAGVRANEKRIHLLGFIFRSV
jgi:hypothetical protein